MTKGLDLKIKKLKDLEEKISDLTTLKEALRKEIFTFVEKENLDQYKVDGVATISRVVRKAIKFIKPQEEIIDYFKKILFVDYLEEVPAITRLSAKFADDVKNGVYENTEIVEVVETTGPMIRFEK